MAWVLALLATVVADERTLPGTQPLRAEKPLDVEMLDGLHRLCLRALVDSRAARWTAWQNDFRDGSNRAVKQAERRTRLRERLGVVDTRVTSDATGGAPFELITPLGGTAEIARMGTVRVQAVRWPVLEGVTAEGLILQPDQPRAAVIALPDAQWTPEQLVGLRPGIPESATYVRRLAAAGCLVVIPTLVSRSDEFSGHPHVGWTNQPHREFLYRQAFEVGRHVIGYEVQKVLAAVDLLERMGRDRPNLSKGSVASSFPIGVAGIGEGGLLALNAAALDERITATLVSGYFDQREGIWREPIDRNVWGLLREAGDAEIASLIAPRQLVLEASRAPEFTSPTMARAGRTNVAAPGRIVAAPLASTREEVERAKEYFRRLGCAESLTWHVSGDAGGDSAGSKAAVEAFARALALELDTNEQQPDAVRANNATQFDKASEAREAARERRQFEELQEHVQAVLRRSHRTRDARWRMAAPSRDAWEQTRPALRDWVHRELIGVWDAPRRVPAARSRQVLDTAAFRGYEVQLEVTDDLIAGGILLVPKNLVDGRRYPVVVCQHGLESVPDDTVRRDAPLFPTYRAFSAQLAERGYIVFAPQNPYRGEDRFRVVQRMSNPLGRTLFSYIVAQHDQILTWLASLPMVDANRIGFYGLSYGGKTAMRVPPMLDRYAVTICSGDFTDWVRTIATNDERCGYAFTKEYEIPEWNMAHIANYAELAMLIAPRPFQVEAGHRDSGQPPDWVAAEFGKVRRYYDELGISERTALEFFNGPHTIHGQGTFEFLDAHLRRARMITNEWKDRP